jgi:hypothetical protein
MRVEIGDLVSVLGVRGFVYITDAAEEPESIIRGFVTEFHQFNINDKAPVAEFRLLNQVVLTDNSLARSLFEYPFTIWNPDMVESGYEQI